MGSGPGSDALELALGVGLAILAAESVSTVRLFLFQASIEATVANARVRDLVLVVSHLLIAAGMVWALLRARDIADG